MNAKIKVWKHEQLASSCHKGLIWLLLLWKVVFLLACCRYMSDRLLCLRLFSLFAFFFFAIKWLNVIHVFSCIFFLPVALFVICLVGLLLLLSHGFNYASMFLIKVVIFCNFYLE